jgi:hypothetical protein
MARMHEDELPLDVALVGRLIVKQFPRWQRLTVRRVEPSGTVNAIFRLGNDLSAHGCRAETARPRPRERSLSGCRGSRRSLGSTSRCLSHRGARVPATHGSGRSTPGFAATRCPSRTSTRFRRRATSPHWWRRSSESTRRARLLDVASRLHSWIRSSTTAGAIPRRSQGRGRMEAGASRASVARSAGLASRRPGRAQLGRAKRSDQRRDRLGQHGGGGPGLRRDGRVEVPLTSCARRLPRRAWGRPRHLGTRTGLGRIPGGRGARLLHAREQPLSVPRSRDVATADPGRTQIAARSRLR